MLKRNVLIFHQAALGDFVLTWPLAIALGRLYPQSRVRYVTAGSKGRLAERVIGVDALDAETGWPALFGEAPKVTEPVARALAGAHAIFDFVGGAETKWAANVAGFATGADLLRLPTRPTVEDGRHAIDHLRDALTSRPAIATAMDQILRSVRDRGVAARRGTGDAIVLHPGSGSLAKNWPIEHFIELARRLRAINRPVRILIGEVERDRMDGGQRARLAELGEVREPRDYVELHAALIDAAVYVGNDSGPTHLAAMCGVPTVALFVSTNPRVWSPVGPHVTVLEGAGLSVDQVVEQTLATASRKATDGDGPTVADSED